MSIIYSNQNGWLVSHLDFILKVYAEGLNKKKDCRESVELLDSEICEFKKGNKKNSELQVKEAHSQKSEWTEADSTSYEKGLIEGYPASCEKDLEAYTLQGFLEMFNIQAPFLKDEQFVKLKAQAHNPTQLSSFKSKKRRRTPSVIDEESVLVKLLFTRFSEDMKSEKSNSLLVPPQPNSISIPLISTITLSYCTSHQFNSISSPTTPTIPSVPSPYLSISHATDNNQKARKQCACVYDLMRKYFEGEDTVSQNKDMDKVPFQGENETEHVVKVEIKNPNSGITDHFILPPRCKFYNWDISYLYGTHQLPDVWTSSRFDFVLLDPPWSNKFVRRKKRQKTNTSNSWYNTMDSVSQLCQIPIAGLLHPSGLVAVWCTNNPSHIAHLTGAVFSAWGLKLVATWYWVKVTNYQDPVLDFSSAPHAKQPYERLLLAVRNSTLDTSPKVGPEDQNAECSLRVLPQDKRIVVSVPSSVHSHKPPLSDILAPYLPRTPRCVELFARSLTPGWLSLGNQVLAFQFETLYR